MGAALFFAQNAVLHFGKIVQRQKIDGVFSVTGVQNIVVTGLADVLCQGRKRHKAALLCGGRSGALRLRTGQRQGTTCKQRAAKQSAQVCQKDAKMLFHEMHLISKMCRCTAETDR